MTNTTPNPNKTSILASASPDISLQASELSLLRMKERYLDGVMAIESVSFGRHHWSRDAFLTEMANTMGQYSVLWCPKTKTVLGYSGAWLVLDEGHITTVASHPDYRGRSLGEVLLQHLLGQFYKLKASWLTLEVRSGNIKAQNLYYKYGFQIQGHRPKYYQDNFEDALIMTTPNLQEADYWQSILNHKEALAKNLGGLPVDLGELALS